MSTKPKILVVDDDRSICKLMGSILEMESYPFRLATSGEQARRAIEEESFDILVSDIYLGDDSGLTLLERMKAVNSDAEVVIMTAHGSMETAVHAVHNGAFDYISKPFVVDEMLGILHRIEEKFRMVEDSARTPELIESFPNTEIIGTTPKMVDVYKKVAKIARIEAPVLVIGDSGSGKELIARALHANSARASAPFIVINCGALTETLLESELFGHERGAFTGATGARKGLLESGSGGTVFLDEISETSLTFQVKLLRVIQEREIRRVGSNETTQVNIRLIAATNRDLREMVRSNQFREDLFHRLNVFTIALPALRDRVEDIPMLASYYMKIFSEKNGRTVRLAPEALDAMKRYSWPGNVRELKNMLERAITFNSTGVIQFGELEFGEACPGAEKPSASPSAAVTGQAPTGSLDEMEREHIIRILKETGGNKKKAAEILGIERRTLYNKAKRLGIDFRAI
ncbi:MAG: two-component system response regulator [Acidobacteria bacterium]|nr:MAG: two-component system response regulator [Acidobacteriota bacterium]